MWVKSSAAFVLAGVGAIAACSNNDDSEKIRAARLAEGCSLNSNCEDPLVCTFARCHKQCDEDRDCPGEQRCVKTATGHVCQLDVETDCTNPSAKCPQGEVCGVDKECRDSCSGAGTGQCTAGQICAASNQCASSDAKKDSIDGDGNIQRDPFNGTGGVGGTGGSGGSGSTSGSGGVDSGVGGTSGSVGVGGASGSGGTGGSGGAGGTGGTNDDGGVDASVGGMGGTGGTGGSGGVGGTGGSSGSVGGGGGVGGTSGSAGTGGSAGSSDAGKIPCDAGGVDCDGNPDNGCEALLASDPKNCSACGFSCAGGPCSNGQCAAELVLDPPEKNSSYDRPRGHLVGNTLYEVLVATNGSWTVRSVSLPFAGPAGPGTVVANQPTGGVGPSAFDSNYLYFITTGNPPTLFKKGLSGPGPSPQVFSTQGIQIPGTPLIGLQVVGTDAYFLATATKNGFYKGSIASSDPPTGISGLTALGGVYDMIVAGNQIVWIERSATAYQIFTAPTSGGTPVLLDDNASSIGINGTSVQFSTDGAYVYWATDLSTGRIRRVLLSNATQANVEDVAAPVALPQGGVVVDGTYAYYRDISDNFYRTKKDGKAEPELLTQLKRAPYLSRLFAVDGNYVYGISGGHEVVRLAKTR